MCFSLGQSAAFTGVGLLTAVLLHWYGKPPKYAVLPAFLALMEALQTAQYLVIDDCSSKVNQLLTFLGMVHIAFQPLVVNYFLFSRPHPPALGKLSPPFSYPVITKVTMRLCQAAAVLLLVKLIPSLVALLGAHQLLTDALSPHLPARVLSVLLTNTCAEPEMLCGAKLCTLAGKHHLAWIAPQLGTGYYVPSLSVHFFAMFGPSLLFGSTYHRLVMLLVLVSGPLMSEWLVWGGGQAVRRLEVASIWCLFSIAQVLGLLTIDLLCNGIANKRWGLPGAGAAEDNHEVHGHGVSSRVSNGLLQTVTSPKKQL